MTKKKKIKGKVHGKRKGIEGKVVEEVHREENKLYKDSEEKESESDSVKIGKVIWDVIKKGVKWFGMA